MLGVSNLGSQHLRYEQMHPQYVQPWTGLGASCIVTPAFEKIGCVCRDHDYHNFLFSMKASNPLVMVQAYRLLSEEMYLKGWGLSPAPGCHRGELTSSEAWLSYP